MTQGERAEERKVGGTSKAETAQEEREKQGTDVPKL